MGDEDTELKEQLVRIKQQLEDCREENNRKLKTAYEDCANIKQGLEKKVQKMTLAAAVGGTVVGGEVLGKVAETVEQVTGLTDGLGALPQDKKDPYALDLDWIIGEVEMPKDNVVGDVVVDTSDIDSMFDAKEGMKFELFEDSWASIPNPAQELETEADLTQAPEKEILAYYDDEDYSIEEFVRRASTAAAEEELIEKLEGEPLIELSVDVEEIVPIVQAEVKKVVAQEVVFISEPIVLQPEPEVIVVAESKWVWGLPLLMFWKPRRRNG